MAIRTFYLRFEVSLIYFGKFSEKKIIISNFINASLITFYFGINSIYKYFNKNLKKKMLLMNFAKLFFKKKCIQIYLIFVFLATLIYLLNPYNALDTNFKNAYFRNKLSCLFHDKQANTKLVYKYSSQSKHSPLILVGGSGRSGTTLMRTILDAHPDVNCGPESRIIPDLLEVFKRFEYDEAKNETLNNALSSFIHHLLSTRTTKSSRLCAKDPSVVYFINYALRIFPSAKFVYMIRDGRDVAFSMMKRFKKDFDFKHMKKNL